MNTPDDFEKRWLLKTSNILLGIAGLELCLALAISAVAALRNSDLQFGILHFYSPDILLVLTLLAMLYVFFMFYQWVYPHAHEATLDHWISFALAGWFVIHVFLVFADGAVPYRGFVLVVPVLVAWLKNRTIKHRLAASTLKDRFNDLFSRARWTAIWALVASGAFMVLMEEKSRAALLGSAFASEALLGRHFELVVPLLGYASSLLIALRSAWRASSYFRENGERDVELMKALSLSAGSRSEPFSGGSTTTMRILFMAANPFVTQRLDLEEELRSLELELRGVKHRDHIALAARHAIRPDDLIRYVRSEKPSILHFSGHGSSQGIILRGDGDRHAEVTGPNLRRFLSGRGIDLLVLNACYTKEHADHVGEAVRAVVGTSSSLDDEAARRFTVAFYRAIGEGLSIREAFRDGGDAVALHGLEDVFWSSGALDYVPLQEDRLSGSQVQKV